MFENQIILEYLSVSFSHMFCVSSAGGRRAGVKVWGLRLVLFMCIFTSGLRLIIVVIWSLPSSNFVRQKKSSLSKLRSSTPPLATRWFSLCHCFSSSSTCHRSQWLDNNIQNMVRAVHSLLTMMPCAQHSYIRAGYFCVVLDRI